MHAAIANLTGWACPLALLPEQRWAALRDWAEISRDGDWWWYAGGGVLAALLVVAVCVGLKYRADASRRVALAFEQDASRIGLTRGERLLLQAIANLAGVKEAAHIFTMEEQYHKGMAALLAPARTAGLAPEKVAQLHTTISGLCEKLGFQVPDADVPPAPERSAQIPPGAEVSVIGRNGAIHFDAKVEAVDAEAIVLDTHSLRDLAPSEPVVLRYSYLGSVWEYDGVLLEQDTDRFRITCASTPRDTNRRRFPRVGVRCPALLAEFPFRRKAGDTLSPPTFWPATVAEIGGPGLLLESIVRPPAGATVLAVVRFADGAVVQGAARVRRVDDSRATRSDIAVEFTDLRSDDLAELARQTNLAALAARRADEPARPSAPAMPLAGGKP